MVKETLTLDGRSVPLIRLDTAVIGTGCAGFNAADHLWSLGRRDIALITEGVEMGTSRNTGSDKQTYYKLTLSGEGGDSVMAMAADLCAGGDVDGDTALAEAAGSVRGFLKLCDLGIPFPTNEYGEYVGYKTDHDPRTRATSAGPLTSRYMAEALERAVRDKGIPVLDGLTAVQLLMSGGAVEGLLCLDRAALADDTHGLTVILARQVILATGGPAGCYEKSVYPESQTGMSGMALEAGAEGANLDRWQYGLASLSFRWNVSGTYQQVLPRYISVDEDGREREFLAEFFDTLNEALDRVFLKGYQWPFDAAKAAGSSLIDLLVYRETEVLGRRVYMDYRTDPKGLEQDFEGLSEETRDYLRRSGALLKTPIARLEKMNPAAIELYRSHGIDLYREPLEIGVCTQHHNGGLAVDVNWQTNIKGLYAVGEAAGTFGASRPGGSALNSTQVGSRRAAEHIAYETPDLPAPEVSGTVKAAATELFRRLSAITGRASTPAVWDAAGNARGAMSRIAAHLRDPAGMAALAKSEAAFLAAFFDTAAGGPEELPALFKARDMAITRLAVLSAMQTAAEAVGSHGSALVCDPGGDEIDPRLGTLRIRPAKEVPGRLITRKTAEGFVSAYRPPRPLPHPDNWFETVWSAYKARTEHIGGAEK